MTQQPPNAGYSEEKAYAQNRAMMEEDMQANLVQFGNNTMSPNRLRGQD